MEEDAKAKEIVFPQMIPQYIEVPPNIKAKQIVSSYSYVLSD